MPHYSDMRTFRFILVWGSLLFTFLVIYNPFVDIETKPVVVYNTHSLENDTFTQVTKSGIVEVAESLIPMPEKLNRNEVCFYNVATRVYFVDGNYDNNVTSTVHFNKGEKLLVVPFGEKGCVEFVGNHYIFNWAFKYTFEDISQYLGLNSTFLDKITSGHAVRLSFYPEKEHGNIEGGEYAVVLPSTKGETRRELVSAILRSLILWAGFCGFLIFLSRVGKYIREGE